MAGKTRPGKEGATLIVLTGRQRAAVEVRGTSVALSAGAGCGKTSVLTERFLLALEEHEDGLEALIALTFTEKAARELRGRVRAEGRRRLGLEDEDPLRWRAILRGLEAAPIGTFHGFCQGLLCRFPIEAGLEPEFDILEEALAPTFRRRAIDKVMNGWLAEQRPDLIALGVEFGLDQVRRWLSSLIEDHGPDRFEKWANRSVEEVMAIWRSAWREGGPRALLDVLVESSREMLRLIADLPCSNPVMIERMRSLLEHLPTIAEDRDPRERLNEMLECAKVRGAGKKDNWTDERTYSATMKQFESFRKKVRDIQREYDFDDARAAKAAALGLRFARLGREARRAYDDAKFARGLLDFDDLLRFALTLIDGADDRLASDLARSSRFLLVDEFQDTDATQGAILERLAGDELTEGRLFLVGDPKQSIYRFRGAEPRIFDTYRERFPHEGRKELTENFRGLPDVLDFVNALFAATFPNEPPLEAGPGAPARDGSPHVHFLWASEGVDDDDTSGNPKQNADERRTIEAKWLARWLSARLSAGWSIYDRRTKVHRQAGAGDVVMLFRTLNDVRFIEKALVEVGLEYHEVGGAAFYSQREVIDVVNLLATIDDPLDAPALAATLRGPFFHVSDDGLLRLSQRRDMAGLGDFVAGFEAGELLPGMSKEDNARVQRARRLLNEWRAARDRTPLAELLDRALAETGHEATLMAEGPLGPRRRANLRKLVALARGYDRQGGWTLTDLVARLRSDVSDRKPPREEEAATTEEAGESVRLMTIHQAKGLEFPIVVLPDLNREGRAITDRVVLDPELGMLVKPSSADKDLDPESEHFKPPSPAWTLYDHRERMEEEREALRVFYVATTRAETHLVLSSGFHIGRDGPKSPAMRLVARRFDLSSGALLEDGPEGPRPIVEVITQPPGEVAGRPIATPHADLPRLAAFIREAPETGMKARPVPRRPRFLDLDPARLLPPTAARLHRLMRALLSGRFLDDSFITLVGRQQVPAATTRLVNQATERIRLWLGRDPQLVSQLDRGSGSKRAWPWHVVWPEDQPEATIVQGQAEFLIRRRDRSWGVCLVTDPLVPEAHEWLRLQLSALAAERAGYGPVTLGRIVQLGQDRVETLEAATFNHAAINDAWDFFGPTSGP